jgi:hypothetical protein
MRQLVANPELQQQMVDYAKQACSVFPSFQASCEADVDQYAPMVFGMALAYLQPEQVGAGQAAEAGCRWGPGACCVLLVRPCRFGALDNGCALCHTLCWQGR